MTKDRISKEVFNMKLIGTHPRENQDQDCNNMLGKMSYRKKNEQRRKVKLWKDDNKWRGSVAR
jgi:hypothetical protein